MPNCLRMHNDYFARTLDYSCVDCNHQDSESNNNTSSNQKLAQPLTNLPVHRHRELQDESTLSSLLFLSSVFIRMAQNNKTRLLLLPREY